MKQKTTCYVISHTHWDREWYRTYEGFRNRLIYLMDELIDHLESDPEYRYFHLDGQTILLEDYLEIRPDNRQRLKALLEEGRIIAGPWYVMPDEFLVGGESQIRNLLKGQSICEAYGVETMKNGFLLDCFGHHAQMPQILEGFGCRAAALYRGIGDYPKNAFMWIAPNGSEIIAMKLDSDRSYSNFYFAIRWPFDDRVYEPIELAERGQALIDFSRNLAVSDELLMLDGVDHLEIEPELPEIIRILNEGISDVEFIHASLADYEVALRASKPSLEGIDGELYEIGQYGINNQLLKNVLSSMVHIKQLNDLCERTITRWAEPFEAFASFSEARDTAGFFDLAWKFLIQNHPHDSICGCSISRVHEDNEFRFNQCNDILHELLTHSFRALNGGSEIRSGDERRSVSVFNAGQLSVEGVVEAELELLPGTQGIIALHDSEGNDVPFQIIEAKRGNLSGKYRYRRLPDFVERDVVRVAFEANIPGCGLETYSYTDKRIEGPGKGDYSYRSYYEPRRSIGNMRTGAMSWDTGPIVLTVNDGALDLFRKSTNRLYSNVLAFENCGDVGDGWNYRKPLHDRRIISNPGSAEVSVLDDGPFFARIQITHAIAIPTETDPAKQVRSTDVVPTQVVTTVTVKKGSTILEFATRITNRSMDHRLRVLFATGFGTDLFLTSTPFWMQERMIAFADKSNYIETETNVYPNQGVISIADSADRLNVYNRGLYEVEVFDDESRTIALTLFRSFRRETGTSEASRGGRQFRTMEFDYALDLRSADENPGVTTIRGTDWRAGTRSRCYAVDTSPEAGPSLAQNVAFLSIEGDLPLSSFRRTGDGVFVLRLFNPTAGAAEGSVEFLRKVERCERLGMDENPFGIDREVDTGFMRSDGNRIELQLEPGEIITLGLEFGES